MRSVGVMHGAGLHRERFLVRRVTLAPLTATPASELTEAGAELGPAVMALARWGLKWARRAAGGRGSSPVWAVLAIEAIFDPEAAHEVEAVYEFRVDGDVFQARVDRGTIELVEGRLSDRT